MAATGRNSNANKLANNSIDSSKFFDNNEPVTDSSAQRLNQSFDGEDEHLILGINHQINISIDNDDDISNPFEHDSYSGSSWKPPQRTSRAASMASSMGGRSVHEEMTHEDIFDGPSLGESAPSLSAFGRPRTSRALSTSSRREDEEFEEEFMSPDESSEAAGEGIVRQLDLTDAGRSNLQGSSVLKTVEVQKPLIEAPTFRSEVNEEQGKSRRVNQKIHLDEEDIFIIVTGYETCKWLLYAYYVVGVLTVGLVPLFLYWFPKYYIQLLGRKRPFDSCKWVLVENQWGEFSSIDIIQKPFRASLTALFPVEGLKEHFNPDTDDPFLEMISYFDYRYSRLMYHPTEDKFFLNHFWKDPRWFGKIKEVRDGLDQGTYHDRKTIFGKNLIDIVEKPAHLILIEEAIHPFYVFQIASIILWSTDTYYYYASCIFLISVISVFLTLIDTKRTMKRLRSIARFNCDVRVIRGGFWSYIDSSDLVPGDVFEISDPTLSILPCDALLLSGDAIVNESMLTGESIPVSKTPASNADMHTLFDINASVSKDLAKHYLFGGTKLVQVKKPPVSVDQESAAIAMTIRTGFDTTKGALVRSMLYPKPVGFKFYRDSFRFIGVMSIIGVIGSIYCIIIFLSRKVDASLIIRRALDIITVAVPPALPATLSIGITFAIQRLKKKQVSCISPQRVNFGGKVDLMAFDKTGTLTEEGLDILGVIPVNSKENKFVEMQSEVSEIVRNLSDTGEKLHELLICNMACCHSLRKVDKGLIGDPLDGKVFEFTKWDIEEVNERSHVSSDPSWMRADLGPRKFSVIKCHEFVSSLRRMSVIARLDDDHKCSYVFTKGAPEIIPEICRSETIPEDFKEFTSAFTFQGYRVIACACKEIDDEEDCFNRLHAETDLTFLGLIVFENKLKPTTKHVIEQLKQANIRTVMCSGDNILTAICVGKESKIVDDETFIFAPQFSDDYEAQRYIRWENVDNSALYLDSNTLELDPQCIANASGIDLSDTKYALAISGDVFNWLAEYASPEMMEVALSKGLIYARMSPDDKRCLVDRLRELGHTIGFCGDGANDCGALKAADIGISLSEAETSVAAPFTSQKFEISCVLDVIKEGRAALTNSFSCFQFMTLYSAIQFASVLIMYSNNSNLGDFQFLWIDLFIIIPVAIFMGRSRPYPKINPTRPASTLVCTKVIGPLLLQVCVIFALQIFIWDLVIRQKWAKRPEFNEDFSSVNSTDNTVVFLFANLQYLLYVIILNVGPPYRMALYRNISFMVTLLVEFAIAFVMIFCNFKWMEKILGLVYVPMSFKIVILAFAVLNTVIALIGQQYLFSPISEMAVHVFRSLFYGGTKRKIIRNYRRMSYSEPLTDPTKRNDLV